MLNTKIKGITGHNNLAYFKSKLNPEIDPTCRLCLQAKETLHHLMNDCEATTSLQMDIMKNQIPLLDMTWSVKDTNKFVQHPLIHSLMTYDTHYNNREMNILTITTHLMPALCELTPWCSPVGGADGGWHGAYGWSNKPPPLARKMPSRFFYYWWASLASKEGAFPKKTL